MGSLTDRKTPSAEERANVLHAHNLLTVESVVREIRLAEQRGWQKAREAAARKAAIHSNYPAENEHDEGYNAGRVEAAAAIRALPDAPPDEEPSDEPVNYDNQPRCPENVETATTFFESAGYDANDCAGCGLPLSEHIDD